MHSTCRRTERKSEIQSNRMISRALFVLVFRIPWAISIILWFTLHNSMYFAGNPIDMEERDGKRKDSESER